MVSSGTYRIKNVKGHIYLDESKKNPGKVHGWSSRPENDNQKVCLSSPMLTYMTQLLDLHSGKCNKAVEVIPFAMLLQGNISPPTAQEMGPM